MAVWVIRGGSDRGLHEEEFIASGRIGIDFGVEGTAHRPNEALRQEIRAYCLWYNKERGRTMEPSNLEGVITRKFKQVLLFRDSVKLGDTVIMPRKRTGGRRVRRGVVQGECEFLLGTNYPQQRRVEWEAEDVPRLATPYYWSPSSRQTIFKVG